MTGLLVLQGWLLVGAKFGSTRTAIAKAATTGQIKGTRHDAPDRVQSFLFERAHARERVEQSHSIGMKWVIKDRPGKPRARRFFPHT
jgi:hypothetical protein